MSLTTTLTAIDEIIRDAGTRRDGTATARVETALTVLDAIYRDFDDLSSRRAGIVSAVRDKARVCRQYCLVHDMAARHEIDDTAYGLQLAELRSRYTA